MKRSIRSEDVWKDRGHRQDRLPRLPIDSFVESHRRDCDFVVIQHPPAVAVSRALCRSSRRGQKVSRTTTKVAEIYSSLLGRSCEPRGQV
jgi:hypothetical protein